MPAQVPTAWNLEGPTSRRLEPAEQVVLNVTQPPPPPTPMVYREPAYMVVKLSQITKKQFMEANKGNVTARRPLGFIVAGVDVRVMYISEDDKYYEGKLDPDYTDRMFTERQTTGVEVITRIVFTKFER